MKTQRNILLFIACLGSIPQVIQASSSLQRFMNDLLPTLRRVMNSPSITPSASELSIWTQRINPDGSKEMDFFDQEEQLTNKHIYYADGSTKLIDYYPSGVIKKESFKDSQGESAVHYEENGHITNSIKSTNNPLGYTSWSPQLKKGETQITYPDKTRIINLYNDNLHRKVIHFPNGTRSEINYYPNTEKIESEYFIDQQNKSSVSYDENGNITRETRSKVDNKKNKIMTIYDKDENIVGKSITRPDKSTSMMTWNDGKINWNTYQKPGSFIRFDSFPYGPKFYDKEGFYIGSHPNYDENGVDENGRTKDGEIYQVD